MDDFSLEPVECWWQNQCILIDAQRYCKKFGLHSCNPYHNIQHCELVAKISILYGMKAGLKSNDLLIIGVAGLFHDFNHSGKLLDAVPDKENIQRALYGFQKYSNTRLISFEFYQKIHQIITNTEVEKIDGVIHFKEPVNEIGKFVRDADVVQLLFDDGRKLQIGLAKEMCITWDSFFKVKAVDFINNVHLFTEPAKQHRESMQDFLENWKLA